MILGSVQLGMKYGINNATGKPSRQNALGILEAATSAGIQFVDTADGYGDSQAVIGQFQRAGGRLKILSKFTFSPETPTITACIDRTLHELGVDSIECYSFHRFQDFQNYHDRSEASSLKASKIKLLGVSVYSNDEFRAAIESELVDVIQFPLNLLDHAGMKGTLIEDAKAKKKRLHVRSVYLQGLFFKESKDYPAILQPLIPYVEQLQTIANDNGLTLGEMALLYAFSVPELDGILVGVESVEQLEGGLETLRKKTLSKPAIKAIQRIRVSEKELLSPANWRIG